jgi:hypothetical protein
MSVNKYTCPECNTTLKLKNPVVPGKRIKCPRCGNSFPVPEDEASEEARPVAAPVADDDPDDEEGGSRNPYSFKEGQQTEEADKKKKSLFEEPIRDPRPKSKRGPAQAAVIPPSNGLLAAGILTCLVHLGFILVVIFPVIFGEQRMTLDRWTNVGLGVVFFAVGCFITAGASNMQNLESYTMAVGGAVVACLPVAGFTWPLTLAMGIWCALTLKKPTVKSGFRVMKPRRKTVEE